MEQDPIRKEDVLMFMVINVTKTKTWQLWTFNARCFTFIPQKQHHY